MDKKGFIERFALFASLSVSMIGVGIFYIPAIVSNYVGADSWIAAIITGVVIWIILLLIHKLIKMNKYKDITFILTDIYGGGLGRVISFMYSVVIIVILSLSLRVFCEVVTMYLLVNTPTEVIIITFIFMGMYLSRGGLANVVHFNEIAFWIMFIPLTIILILTLPEADFKNLLPIGTAPIQNYFLASFEMLFVFNGFSMAFILIPYVKERNKVSKTLKISSIFVGVFYCITFILVSATLSKAQAVDSIFPTITMLQSISSRSGILEKWDSLVMALWVIFYFTSFANIYYFGSSIIKDVFKIEDIRTASMLYIPLVYLATMFPENILEVRNFRFAYLRIGFIGGIIVVIGITLVISCIRRKRRVRSEE
ncbi:MAG: GerAB/ArcD/ProY family transporter [Clostridium sp.]|uniref:GerAB/ArcD/ProY family transporter n=1 Tax=Clostridium sp. TaxID=1506 RepID=UPI0030750CED